MNPTDRSSWPVYVYPLMDAPGPDLRLHTTAKERLAMVWALTVEAWTLTGKPIPECKRSEGPVKIVSLRESGRQG